MIYRSSAASQASVIDTIPQAISILVVEDDPDDFGLIDAYLRQTEYWRSIDKPRLTWTKTLAEGIEAARHQQPDVVLLDLSLPDSSSTKTVVAMNAALCGDPIVVFTDTDANIQWANPAFTQITGFSIAEVLGRNPSDQLKSGKQDQAFNRHMWETILSGQEWRGDLVNRRKDGSLYDEALAIAPVIGCDGAIHNFIAIKQGSSDRKRTEQQLLELAESQKERVSELLINVAKHAGVSEANLDFICDNNQLIMVVSDGGCGFDTADFRQASPGQRSFGLSSIHERITNIGGEMDIDSNPGQGTTVTLTLSCAIAVKEALPS